MAGWAGGRARGIRRSVPIHAYVGPNGGGKTLAMIYDTLPTLAAGRPVLSTVRLLESEEAANGFGAAGRGGAHRLYTALRRMIQVLDAEHCDLLLDEVTGVASARAAMSMPVQLQNTLVQLRRRDVVLRWTAPNWARADTIMRECTQAVTVCRGFAAVTEPGREWPAKRLFVWRTFDAAMYEDFTAHRAETARTVAKQVFWRPGSEAERAYDTLDAVDSLDTMSELGHCLTCNGSRPRPKCRCDAGDGESLAPVRSVTSKPAAQRPVRRAAEAV
jgi:hypothetical protein